MHEGVQQVRVCSGSVCCVAAAGMFWAKLAGQMGKCMGSISVPAEQSSQI